MRKFTYSYLNDKLTIFPELQEIVRLKVAALKPKTDKRNEFRL